MPLTKTMKKIKSRMVKTYGSKKKGEQVFYAMENKMKSMGKKMPGVKMMKPLKGMGRMKMK